MPILRGKSIYKSYYRKKHSKRFSKRDGVRRNNNMSDLKIFTENIEPQALNQIYTLIKQPAFADCKVRVMPDEIL